MSDRNSDAKFGNRIPQCTHAELNYNDCNFKSFQLLNCKSSEKFKKEIMKYLISQKLQELEQSNSEAKFETPGSTLTEPHYRDKIFKLFFQYLSSLNIIKKWPQKRHVLEIKSIWADAFGWCKICISEVLRAPSLNSTTGW